MCPSDAVFTISLGPTNPGMTTIAQETLIFRREGISPSLRLLVPTFLLPHAPRWVTPFASTQSGTLVYRLYIAIQSLNFGDMLESRSSVAQSLSMGELSRFLSMVAASKPTSSLSMKLHILAYT